MPAFPLGARVLQLSKIMYLHGLLHVPCSNAHSWMSPTATSPRVTDSYDSMQVLTK